MLTSQKKSVLPTSTNAASTIKDDGKCISLVTGFTADALIGAIIIGLSSTGFVHVIVVSMSATDLVVAAKVTTKNDRAVLLNPLS
jgi:hypothetical protein